MTSKSVAVIGAGMSGLSAAYHLQKAGFDVTVFEKSADVGGRTISAHKAGYHFDLGALTLSPRYKNTIELLREVAASDLLITSNLTMGFVRDRKVHDLDMSKPLRSGMSTKWLSPMAKLSILKLAPMIWRNASKSHFEGMHDLSALDTENCRTFAERKLGQELHDYFVDPIIRINMFSTTATSSLVDLIWLLNIGSGNKIIQVKGGMGELSRAVASNLHIRFNEDVQSVERQGKRVVVRQSGVNEQLFDGAIIAIPPPQALKLAPWVSPQVHDWFSNVRGVRSLTVQVGVTRRPQSKSSMILIPTRESKDILGITLDHNKCEDRAPEDKGLITLYMTRAWFDGQQETDEMSLAKSALSSTEPFLGDFSDAIDIVNIHQWDYVDHERYVGVYKGLADMRPSLDHGRIQFAGEFISSGIEGAVTSGVQRAKSLAENLLA
jgi:protoporphyrinogen/coproporphyrinogen III oxidase